MRWLTAARNLLDGLFPRPIDMSVRRSPQMSPVEFYRRQQTRRVNAWQEVDR